MKKTILVLSATVILSACGDRISFNLEDQCSAVFTGKRDSRREQGACIQKNQNGTCIQHSYHYVTYLQREVSCKKKEWIR